MILVTGSRGYIGSRLRLMMEKNKINFIEFDRDIGDDILDKTHLMNKAKYADAIVHLAGMVGMDLCKKDPSGSYDINVKGTENVLSCGKPIIFTGVLAGYDVSGIVDETTPMVAKNDYYIQKKTAEDMMLKGGDAIVLRLGSLYGSSPKMRWDLMVHNFIVEAVKTGKIELFQPEVMRPISNIADVCNAIMVFGCNHRYIGNNLGIYNVVSMNTTKMKIAQEVANATGCKINIVNKSDPEGRNYTVSTKKIKSLNFKFNPRFSGCVKEVVDKAKKEFSE